MPQKLYKIELSEEAEEDFDQSYQYYFHESERLADRFYLFVNKSFAIISKSPFLSPEVYKNIRKYILKKFPFVIYFQVEDSTVKVIAIFHCSRNPKIWNERIKK